MSLSWVPNGWFVEGQYLSYIDEGRNTIYSYIRRRDFAHYEWPWGFPAITTTEERTITSGGVLGPLVVNELEPTQMGQIFQIIFGIKPDIYVYTEVPSDMKRHGLSKRSKHSSQLRRVGNFTMRMSPYFQPSMITEFFLLPKLCPWIAIDLYNPKDHSVMPFLNFWINKLELQGIGYESPAGELFPRTPRFAETLDRLARHLIPCRPITWGPVRAAPVEVPSGIGPGA